MVEKPYFYPRSLQAPASSWILVSENFENYSNDLSLVGLVIVTVIEGELDVSLTPREECRELCHKLSLKLFSGESLVYLHQLWKFSYRYVAEKSFTLTFITETDFYEWNGNGTEWKCHTCSDWMFMIWYKWLWN